MIPRRPHGPVDDAIRELVSDLRFEARMTQADLARAAGRPQIWLQRLERGERAVTVAHALAICRALGIPFASFARRLEMRLRAAQVKAAAAGGAR